MLVVICSYYRVNGCVCMSGDINYLFLKKISSERRGSLVSLSSKVKHAYISSAVHGSGQTPRVGPGRVGSGRARVTWPDP